MQLDSRDEAFRQYVADQVEQQTRLLRRIADNTAALKVLAIVLLALLAVSLLVSLIGGFAAAGF